MAVPEKPNKDIFDPAHTTDVIEDINEWMRSLYNPGAVIAETVDNLARNSKLHLPPEQQIVPIEGLSETEIHKTFEQSAAAILERTYVQNVISQNRFQRPNSGGELMTGEEQLRWFKQIAKANYLRTMHNISFSLQKLSAAEDDITIAQSRLVWIDPEKSIKKPVSIDLAYKQETSGEGNQNYYPNGGLITISELIKRLSLLSLFQFPLKDDLTIAGAPGIVHREKSNQKLIVRHGFISPRNPHIFVAITERFTEDKLQSINEDLLVTDRKRFSRWLVTDLT